MQHGFLPSYSVVVTMEKKKEELYLEIASNIATRFQIAAMKMIKAGTDISQAYLLTAKNLVETHPHSAAILLACEMQVVWSQFLKEANPVPKEPSVN